MDEAPLDVASARASENAKTMDEAPLDVVIVGAGISGLLMLRRLKTLGFAAKVLDAAADIGGTWQQNRYPGCRCDVESRDYQYGDAALAAEWSWSERYPSQPEILRYLHFVSDKYALRSDVVLNARVVAATYDDATWTVAVADDKTYRARFLVMATGCLSVPKKRDGVLAEVEQHFAGEVLETTDWPADGEARCSGKRVGVVGTGSSGVQCIPEIAKLASHLAVFQRTPAYCAPALNRPLTSEEIADHKAHAAERFEEAKATAFGLIVPHPGTTSALDVDAEERGAVYERCWNEGLLVSALTAYTDIIVNADANDTIADFSRMKIHSIVRDPETAADLTPTYAIGTKRMCLDTNYYDTFNLDHVRLVNLRRTPIRRFVDTGVELAVPVSDDVERKEDHAAAVSTTPATPRKEEDEAIERVDLDVIVLATGFDAMTGALLGVDVQGKDGRTLREVWKDGPVTYLGLTVAGFPNLFTITGPLSPSVLSNMTRSIEQHVDWIAACLDHMRANRLATIDAKPQAQEEWVAHAAAVANMTLFSKNDSWYVGANVPGKPRTVMPYIGGLLAYKAACDKVAEAGYDTFSFTSA
eukprot:CAMPEP_0198651570 /NCGR_PEP_ID=MMETSP1467-20131203/5774_1 /TAXON_ID=1462469 /ORGANISM="unid. sp., Strain CCMP2135" /LENGTH=585 /DNA_ID=CAMNT_0044387469 /DNA_START=6 /DNA_END=1763 /DNA_ORIENTATION=+